MAWHSKTWTWFGGEWHEGNPPIIGPRSHASWLGSSVFDGARVFEGIAPDLDLHLARVNRSAGIIGLNPTQSVEAMAALVREGASKFDAGATLYVKPMYWGEAEGIGAICPDPDSVGFCMALFEAAMAPPVPASLTKGAFRRPTIETMPTDSKAGCLYPNNARILREAQSRGFSNALVLDMLGNVAETATSNIFLVKDGAVFTPIPNGTFLNGITRQRVIRLLRESGVAVFESVLRYEDFLGADEVFATGNYSKVTPVGRIDDREIQPGPVYRKARELYWDFAHSGPGV
ncbi:MAG: branched-chain amino acid aminotransferase [Microvirga sp.]|nr:branched-chain amino acid aminotransferase [Microvirga sp.]